ncbi:TPA: glycosyltransferase [Klebsiella pneumoniae]|uniref:glycosyltransferase n=1 Tax=Klebsiella pneumoniae TaxID=573 RepID=UPI00192CC337|nr:glycosyltransferase [Klebsiella pneumoniae]MBL4371554.1 glycosyltransferase [Klebsiella pneumoniae]MCP6347220.1 glycosyltransferase [Klebsiella pneumoniae]HBV2640203.1 glycosyltransferase [Klebsiella pneumoniae]HBV2645959.1 glycosyltransferase [Klebsiella pneumoniae]HBV3051984.1 glycosyltransferase [Klebsiella pneumoniae]
MKISFFCIKFPIASETFVLNQVISFMKMGYDVNIISIFPGDMEKIHEDFETYKVASKTTYIFKTDNRDKKVFTLFQRFFLAFKCLAKGNIDAFNIKKFSLFSKNLLLPSLAGTIKKKIEADFFIAHFGPSGVLANSLRNIGCLDGKLITVFHGNDLSAKELLFKYQEAYQTLFLEGDYFLPISKLWQNKLIDLGCSSDKISVIRMGIKVDEFPFERRNFDNAKLKIVSVCRLTEKKGIQYSILACKILRDQGFSFTYKIVGYGELTKPLQRLIENNGLENHVSIVGFQPQIEVKKILKESNVFLLPSVTAEDGDMEGIPVALMEAMASGLPVVSTYHSGIPELISDGKTGWLCPEKDAECIASALSKIISSGYNVYNIVNAARIQIEDNFNQNNEYTKMASLLESLR